MDLATISETLADPAAGLVGVRLIGWQELPEKNELVFGAFGPMMNELAASSGASPGLSSRGHC